MSLNQPKAKMGLNEPKWAQKTLNISKIILCEPKIGLNEIKWESLNELKGALMRSNLTKIFTIDAYPVQDMTYVTIFKAT